MNEPPKKITRMPRDLRMRAQGIDFKAAYTILLKAYWRNHPKALELEKQVEEVSNE